MIEVEITINPNCFVRVNTQVNEGNVKIYSINYRNGKMKYEKKGCRIKLLNEEDKEKQFRFILEKENINKSTIKVEMTLKNSVTINKFNYKDIIKISDNDIETRKRCKLCRQMITDFEYKYDGESSYHNYCFHFAYCGKCKNKHDLKYCSLEGMFFCNECFEEVKKSKSYRKKEKHCDYMKIQNKFEKDQMEIQEENKKRMEEETDNNCGEMQHKEMKDEKEVGLMDIVDV